MPSPPKPWERAGSAITSSATPSLAAPAPTTPAAPTSDFSAAPIVPARPNTLSTTTAISDPNAASTALNPYASTTTPYGASPYSRFGSYTSPYSSYGSTGYGGYGGYGSSYGGMGGGLYGGMGGGYGMGMPGMMPMDPNNPSLIQQVGSSTSQTFALIQSIVQTFGGFAQMLDSTFMATQSSFFAMLGVAEQFTHLRGALSQVFGVFGLVAWLRSWFKGEKPNMAAEFKRFLQSPPPPQNGPNGTPAPKPSKKPLIVFLLAVFGLPYAMHRLIKHLSQNLPEQQQPLLPGQQPPTAAIDPTKLSFARATYVFQTTDPIELSLAKGEIVAVLSTQDPTTGAEGEWWHGRTRDGREGWFPASYVEVIKPKEALAPVPPVAPAAVPAAKPVA